MPIMLRPSRKARKIVNSILGTSPTLKKDRKKASTKLHFTSVVPMFVKHPSG